MHSQQQNTPELFNLTTSLEVKRSMVNTTTSGEALVRKVQAGPGLLGTSTGINPGTGDVVVYLPTLPNVAGVSWSSVTTDAFGRVVGGVVGVGASLPIATPSVLGCVKVGSGLGVTSEGILYTTGSGGGTYTLPTATSLTLGGIRIGTGLAIDGSGIVSVSGIAYTLPVATSTILGGVTVGTGLQVNGSGLLSFDSSVLSAFTGSTSLITLGTVTSGAWHGTTVAANYGGTGFGSYGVGDLLYANTTTTLAKFSPSGTGVLRWNSGWSLDTTAYQAQSTALTNFTTLGNPSSNGYVLASTTSGVLSWIAPGSGGVGTVTSVALTAPSLFTVSGSPVTTTGTLSFAWNGASTNFVLADGSTVAVSTYLTTTAASSSYQPLDGDLTSIAGLAGTSGLARKTAANTWALDTSTYLTANQTITISGDVSGTGTTAITVSVNKILGNTVPANAAGSLSNNGSGALSWVVYETALGNPSTNGYVLSSTTSGVRSWIAPGTGGMSNPLTTTGDMVYSSSGTTPARLAVGTVNQVLIGGTVPTWSSSLTLGGKLIVPASVTGSAYLNLPHGVTPTTLVDGDFWTTTSGVYSRISGATVRLNGSGLYYSSSSAVTIANTTTTTAIISTSLNSGAQTPGNVVDISGDGTIRFASLSDTVTFTIVIGSTTLGTFTIVGTDVVGGTTGVDYHWHISGRLSPQTGPGTSSDIGFYGAFVVVGTAATTIDIAVLGTGINTTISNVFTITTTWSVAAAGDSITANYMIAQQINAIGGAGGSVISVGLAAPSLFTVSGSPVTSSGNLTFAWNGSSSNLVRADGSTLPTNTYQPLGTNLTTLSALGNPSSNGYVLSSTTTGTLSWIAPGTGSGSLLYYSSSSAITVANTTTPTAIMSTSLDTSSQTPGNVIDINSDGSICFAALTDTVTVSIVIGSTTLVSFTVAGTDIDGAVINTDYHWKLTGHISPQTGPGTSSSIGFYGVFTTTGVAASSVVDISVLGTGINTTVSNTLNLNVTWSVAAAGDSITANYIYVQQINAIGGAGGSVISVGLTAPSLFTVTGSPITSSGTLSFAWNGASANIVRADGSTVAQSAFQPTATNLTTLGALGNPSTNGYVLSATTAGVMSWIASGSGSGTVTSISLTAPSLFTVSGSPVTTTGTLSFAWNGSSSNFVLADGTTAATSTYALASALSSYLTTAAAASGYQPLDGDLTSIAGLAGTSGLARKTAANTWVLDTATYLTANQSITWTGSGDVSGTASGTTSISPSVTVTGIQGKSITLATGFLKYTGTVWSFDASTYLTSNQSITLSGDASGTGTTAITVAVNKILGNTVPANASGALTNNGSGALSWVSYLTAAPTITLTGAVTGSGTGSFATTLAASVVGLSNLSNLAANSVVGNATGSAATPTAVSMLATATVSSIALRDASANLFAVNYISGYTATATAGTTTTLSVASSRLQYFTGTANQTVVLPVTSTLGTGFQFIVTNNTSTGAVTVQSSGANAIVVLATGTSAVFTCILASGTTAASWSYSYIGITSASGKVVTINNSLTLSGTDATTMTFPTTSATIARTDAAQTFTGVQTFSSAPTLSSLTTAGVLLNNGSGVISSTAGASTSFVLADGTTVTRATYATIASPTFTGIVTTPALTLSGFTTGTLINTSGVVSALSGTNLVLGNGTTLAQATFQTAAANLTTVAGYASIANITTLVGYASVTNLTSLTGLANPGSTSHLQITSGGVMSWDTATYLTTGTASTTYAPIASPTFTGTVTTPALTMSGFTTGTLINTSGVVSALSGTNLVLGNGTTLAQSTFLTTAPTITLTGNVTGSGTGSFATTIAASAVTLAMQANLAANSVVGNLTGSSATPVAVSAVSTATASTIAVRDANANLSAVNHIDGYTATTTAAGTTTLTVASTKQQYFTGTTTQTVVLPVTSTLPLGQSWFVRNNSTGTVTVQSSGANTVVVLTAGSAATVTCILTSGTTETSWSYTYLATSMLSGVAYHVSGTQLTVANTTTQTSLVTGIAPFSIAAQNLGNVINLELDGTITFASLYNYVTWQWKLGNTVLATFTSIGTDMAAAVVGTAYPWTFNGRIVPQTANGSSATVTLVGQLQVFIPNDTVTVSINETGNVNTTIQNSFNVLVQWDAAAATNSFIRTDVAVTQSTSTLAALVGPAGPVWSPSSSPSFTYTSGLLTRVDYASDSSYKVLTYTGSVLTQVDYVKGGVTTRKVLNYTLGILSSITQTVF